MNFYSLFSNIGIILARIIDSNTGLDSGAAVSEAAAAASEAAVEATAVPPQDDTMSMIFNFLIWGAFIVAIYFFMFRQPRKEQKAKEAMRESIRLGDSVLTTSGFYGKVVDIEDNVFVIEFGSNRGIRVPIRKESIERVEDPSVALAANDSDKSK